MVSAEYGVIAYLRDLVNRGVVMPSLEAHNLFYFMQFDVPVLRYAQPQVHGLLGQRALSPAPAILRMTSPRKPRPRWTCKKQASRWWNRSRIDEGMSDASQKRSVAAAQDSRRRSFGDRGGGSWRTAYANFSANSFFVSNDRHVGKS